MFQKDPSVAEAASLAVTVFQALIWKSVDNFYRTQDLTLAHMNTKPCTENPSDFNVSVATEKS